MTEQEIDRLIRECAVAYTKRVREADNVQEYTEAAWLVTFAQETLPLRSRLLELERELEGHDAACNVDHSRPGYQPGCSCLGRARRKLAEARQTVAEQSSFIGRLQQEHIELQRSILDARIDAARAAEKGKP